MLWANARYGEKAEYLHRYQTDSPSSIVTLPLLHSSKMMTMTVVLLACIDHYARTVSEWSKDNTVSFGLQDMIRRFRDCLGR